MKIGLAVPQEAGNRSTSRFSYTTLRQMSKEQFILLQRHLLNHVHCFFIHSSKNLGKKLDAFNQRMDEEDVIHYTMEYQSAVCVCVCVWFFFFSGIMKIASKWMELEKRNDPEGGNPDPER